MDSADVPLRISESAWISLMYPFGEVEDSVRDTRILMFILILMLRDRPAWVPWAHLPDPPPQCGGGDFYIKFWKMQVVGVKCYLTP